MDSQEREKFWNTLCSLKGTDIQKDCEALRASIQYPKFLYRYRPVTTSSLNALRTNKLYFSKANYYDDPFDTFLHINIAAIMEEYRKNFRTPERTQEVIDGTKTLLSGIIPEEKLEQLTVKSVQGWLARGILPDFQSYLLDIRNEVRKNVWLVCFSGNGLNETLWLKYADQYRGLVQFYDMEDESAFLCGKQEKYKECGIRYGPPIYPIYYSDTPYDATNFAEYIMMQKLTESVGKTIPPEWLEKMKPIMWEAERTTLIKKKCHEYDQEWRMIANAQMNAPVMVEMIPYGVVLGLRMNRSEEDLVIAMAKEAGVKKIYKSFIDEKNELNAYPVEKDGLSE